MAIQHSCRRDSQFREGISEASNIISPKPFSTAYFLPTLAQEDPTPYVFNVPYKRKPRVQEAEASSSKKIKTVEVISIEDDEEGIP